MWSFFKPYWTIAKLVTLIVIMLAAWGYVEYLRSRITSLQEDVRFLREAVRVCDQQKAKFRAVLKFQEENLRIVDKYYRERQQLNLQDRPLTEDDLRLDK